MRTLSSKLVYLDHAAAAPLLPQVLAGHEERCRRFFFNPHSTHQYSESCQRAIVEAERGVFGLLGIDESEAEIIWTSGGTEANNLGIRGCLRDQPRGTCLVEAAAHLSVLQPARAYEQEDGGRVERLPVSAGGELQLPLSAERADERRLVALGQVNNETGAVHDLPKLREWMRTQAPGAFLLVDALQSFGKLPVPWREAEIDLLSVGGRKIGGPPSTGALIVRRGTPLRALLFGGDQQRGLRAGTLDTVGILEFAEAAAVGFARMNSEEARIRELNGKLRARLRRLVEPSPVFVSPVNASPYILSAAFPGYEGAVLMRALAQLNIIVATGSACSAEAAGLSHVLIAMGVPRQVARGVIRISFGADSTEDDIEALAEGLAQVLKEY